MVQAKHAFDRISGTYQRFRPSYPGAVFERIVRALDNDKVPAGFHTMVDVGCGTGIATRQLREAAGPLPRIIGVDVNRDMLRTARQASANCPAIEYTEAPAEALPFSDNSTDLIMVAQAIQWFDRRKFYREACRVLRPNGLLAIMQNNRSWRSSTFLERYEEFLEARSPGYVRCYRDIDLQAEMRQVSCLTRCIKHTDHWCRRMTRSDFIGMAFSSTKMQAAIRRCGRSSVLKEMEALVGKYGGKSGELRVPYVSELFLARKRK